MQETRPCVVCGELFTTSRTLRKYCSGRCQNKAHRDRVRRPLEPIVCGGCRVEFVPTSRRQRVCSKRCHMRVRLGLDVIADERPCGYCGEIFTSRDGRQLYCSDLCGRTSKGLRQARLLYGLEPDLYRDILKRQQGVCAVCRQPERTVRNRLMAVDHDHVTGQIRGLLCSQCNRAIGMLGDDPDRITAAARYVRSHRQQRMSL